MKETKIIKPCSIIELNDNELNDITGGRLPNCPYENELKLCGVDDIVIPTGGWWDTYYDTYRGNGVWKNVGSEDMLNYVRRHLGPNDPRFIALENCCYHRPFKSVNNNQ